MATRRAKTIAIGSTVSLAIAMPAIRSKMSPGAKGIGIPVSSMKRRPAITKISRSPLRLAIEWMGFIAGPATCPTPAGASAEHLANQGNWQVAAVEESVVE
jgi:hypothetical protein